MVKKSPVQVSVVTKREAGAGGSVAGGEGGELQPGEAALVPEGSSADAAARTPLLTQPQLPVDKTHN